jgi:tRNA/rRNA methyltransferase
MVLHAPTPAELARACFVLVEPSHPGNVGAAARAMRVMGLRDLRLVSPRHPGAASHADALAFASGATDVLAACREFGSLDEALADASLAIAVSADAREFGAAPVDPRSACEAALHELAADAAHRVAFVFGTERTGLSIAQAQRCQRMLSIPGEPGYHSLNLSQAVQVVAWEVRKAALARAGTTSASAAPAAPARHATHAQVEALFAHLEQALVAVRFLDPAHPKKLMPRMRRLFSRTRLEVEEVELLRGVCKQMLLAAAAGGDAPATRPGAQTAAGTTAGTEAGSTDARRSAR